MNQEKKIYRNYKAILTKEQFGVLLKALEEKYSKEWSKEHDIYDIANAPSMSNGMSSDFFGYHKDEEDDDSSLYYYMMRNKAVRGYVQAKGFKNKEGGVGFNPKYLYVRFLEAKREDCEKITFHRPPYNYIYFLYLEFENCNDFLQNHPNIGKNEEGALKIEQVDIVASESKQEKKADLDEESKSKLTWKRYFICGLNISDKQIGKPEIRIHFGDKDYKGMKAEMFSDKVDEFNEGVIKYTYPFLEIRFCRKAKHSTLQLPFTAYFKHEGRLENMLIVPGTLSGAGYRLKQSMALVCVLVEQEYYNYKTVKLNIERYLYLSSYGIDIQWNPTYQLSPYFEKNPFPLRTESNFSILEDFEGIHEIYTLGSDEKSIITSYKLEIREDFLGIMYSDNERHQYIIKLSIRGSSLMMAINEIQESGSPYHHLLSNIIAIDVDNKEKFAKTIMYEGFSSGRSRENKAVGFPVLFVLNSPEPQAKKYTVSEVKDIRDKKDEFPLMNVVVDKLYHLEYKRFDKIETLLEIIKPIEKSN